MTLLTLFHNGILNCMKSEKSFWPHISVLILCKCSEVLEELCSGIYVMSFCKQHEIQVN